MLLLIIYVNHTKLHEILSNIIFYRSFIENYDPTSWAGNGPILVTNILENVCNTTKLSKMDRTRCHGFNVYDEKVFYALHYSLVEYSFNEDEIMARDMFELFSNSTLAHMSNALSAGFNITVGSNAAYGLLADTYCPKVYHSCGERF